MSRKEFLRVLCLLTFYQTSLVYCGMSMLGRADVNLKQVTQCENPEQYSSYLLIERKKVNRTHEVFNGDLNLDVDLDDTVGVYINVAKWGDGGYKPNYLVINETSACDFMFKYIEEDVMVLLNYIGRPQKCPIAAVSARVINYSIDYSKLPQEMLYGDFRARVFLVKDGESKLCIEIYVECTPKKLW